ncbi:Type III restriction protein res subunit [Planctomycetales bacterium 10988]|nr:Type III restriction protein res subunit [Planctomycetales bacterium 10988]
MVNEVFQQVAMEARPYQHRIVTKAVQMLSGDWINRFGQQESAAKSVMIESPTGSGKTVMGLTVAKVMQERFGWKIGWVAMRRNLLQQAQAENLSRGFGVEMETISMFEKDPPQVDMLIVDEAQHDAAMSMANLHSIIHPKRILGLTATPFRTDRMKLCFEKVITDAGIQTLIDEGYLSRYHHYTIPAYTPQMVAETFAKEPEHWGKTLMFFYRHVDCLTCQHELKQHGFESEVVTGKTNREKQLEDFHNDRFQVLINMSILTEGFDCPSLKTVFCRPSGKGCTVQMGGRVFRKHADFPMKQIVQCQKTKHPFVKTARPEEQYVWSDSGWKTLKVNKHLNQITQRSLQLIARSQVELPKQVAMHRVRLPSWLESRAS